MDYSNSLRRSAPNRRYSQRPEDVYNSGPSRRYPTEYYGPNDTPDALPPRTENTDYEDPKHRPAPNSGLSRGKNVVRPGMTEEHETIIIQQAGPSAPRGPDRRARVEDEPEIVVTATGANSRPQRADRSRYNIEPEISPFTPRRYGEDDVHGTGPSPSFEHWVPGPMYEEDLRRLHEYSPGHQLPYMYGPRRRQSHFVPPPPPPPPQLGEVHRPEYAIHRPPRRTNDMPPSPPMYAVHINNVERPGRRHSSRTNHRPPPLRPEVPLGYVTPSPYLVSSYQDPPDSGSGHENVGGGSGGGGGRHDLATLAEQPDPMANEKIRNSIVLCVYRHSQKAFDYRFVQLRSSTGHRIDRDREGKRFTTDLHVFQKMRRAYESELRGWIRRLFSFKHLSTVRLLQYGDGMFFRPDQEDDIFSSKFMRIWRNPKEELNGAMDRYEWNRWLLEQKELAPGSDMAVELIEDYMPNRIVFFAGMWLIGIAGLTAAWLIEGGEPGLVSTVMSFVLTFIAAVVALTSVWDWFDGDRSKEIQQRAVAVVPNMGMYRPGQMLGQKGPPPP